MSVKIANVAALISFHNSAAAHRARAESSVRATMITQQEIDVVAVLVSRVLISFRHK